MGRMLLVAFALMLVLEGILPFAVPARWRETMQQLSRLGDGQLRFVGLATMLAGMLLLLVLI